MRLPFSLRANNGNPFSEPSETDDESSDRKYEGNTKGCKQWKQTTARTAAN